MIRRTPLARRTALVARTPLVATKGLARGTTSLAQRGAKSKRLGSFQARCRAVVESRALGICEVPGCLNPAAEWHHVYGRSIGVAGAAKWMNLPALTIMACAPCHRLWHDEKHPDADLVRYLVAIRLGGKLGIGEPPSRQRDVLVAFVRLALVWAIGHGKVADDYL